VSGAALLEEPPVLRSMRAIGTTAVVAVTRADAADAAAELLATDLADIDAAASRFRPDSEIRRLERHAGTEVPVSRLLYEALEVALVVAERTSGTVDPTVGEAMVGLGYDRDFERLAGGVAAAASTPRPAPGWWCVELDPFDRTVRVPRAVHLDLGATAKALVADRSARRIAAELGGGVLVNLGGDVSVAGPPPEGGWAVGIAPDCRTATAEVDQVVAIIEGGLASSGTSARSWRQGDRLVHHIVDPVTGEPAPPVWSLVSVAAPSCVEANAASTAAVVWGHDAPGNLAYLDVAARLVRADGKVVLVGSWPASSTPSADRTVT